MIPADLASRLRVALPPAQQETPQPVLPVQKLTDALSNLVPGQRVLAEVVAMLPNGTYRALVAQRDVTLALPFSAKAGDSLELEVLESDGKITLAFVANRSEPPAGKQAGDSVATSLSSAGKLIGDLLQQVGGEGKRPPPIALNGNQPLVSQMPDDAAELLPVLKQAITQSGMFYEAHQARWVAGKMPTEALQQEPQGKIPVPPHQSALIKEVPPESPRELPPSPREANTISTPPRADSPAGPGAGIPRDLAPIVQQQLDGLSTQNYAWQGQAWPGQPMQWEISEHPEDRTYAGDEPPGRWQTRLKLQLPNLGDIDAKLQLYPDGSLSLNIATASPDGEQRLNAGIATLKNQLAAAGLTLNQALITHVPAEQA